MSDEFNRARREKTVLAVHLRELYEVHRHLSEQIDTDCSLVRDTDDVFVLAYSRNRRRLEHTRSSRGRHSSGRINPRDKLGLGFPFSDCGIFHFRAIAESEIHKQIFRIHLAHEILEKIHCFGNETQGFRNEIIPFTEKTLRRNKFFCGRTLRRK